MRFPERVNLRLDVYKRQPYGEIVDAYADRFSWDVVLVMVNGRLRELHKRLKEDCSITCITTAEPIGHDTYRRSMTPVSYTHLQIFQSFC